MARHLRIYSYVNVIGEIRMPSVTCAMSFSPLPEDLRDDEGNITRDSISDWLACNAGDFQSITDFEANIADGDRDIIIPWTCEDSEFTYSDCMYPAED